VRYGVSFSVAFPLHQGGAYLNHMVTAFGTWRGLRILSTQLREACSGITGAYFSANHLMSAATGRGHIGHWSRMPLVIKLYSI